MNKEDRKDLVEPVAYRYRWKLDREWTNWRVSDASQKHGDLKDLEEIPLYVHPPASSSEIDRLRRELEEARKALEKAHTAIQPFADAVYNDNGDMTVNMSFATYDDFVRAYFVSKKISASLSSAGRTGE